MVNSINLILIKRRKYRVVQYTEGFRHCCRRPVQKEEGGRLKIQSFLGHGGKASPFARISPDGHGRLFRAPIPLRLAVPLGLIHHKAHRPSRVGVGFPEGPELLAV